MGNTTTSGITNSECYRKQNKTTTIHRMSSAKKINCHTKENVEKTNGRATGMWHATNNKTQATDKPDDNLPITVNNAHVPVITEKKTKKRKKKGKS